MFRPTTTTDRTVSVSARAPLTASNRSSTFYRQPAVCGNTTATITTTTIGVTILLSELGYSLHVRSVQCQIKSNGGVIGTMCVSVCVGHVCFCCPAKVVQPTRVGRYGEELPRSASQPVRVSRDERGGGGGRSAKAHIKQTGIMEKRSPLRRTLPSNGVRLLTSLLALYGLTCEYSVYLSFLSALTYFFSGS